MDSALVSFYLQIVYAVGALIFGYAWNKQRGLSARHKGMENGTRALLKMELCRIHRESTSNGFITYDDASIAEEIYAAYHVLGGNGSGTHMMTDIRKMRMMEYERKV